MLQTGYYLLVKPFSAPAPVAPAPTPAPPAVKDVPPAKVAPVLPKAPEPIKPDVVPVAAVSTGPNSLVLLPFHVPQLLLLAHVC